jgi:hypothetical protein
MSQQPANMGRVRHVGDALGSALRNVADGPPHLAPGKGLTNLDLGMQRVVQHAIDMGVQGDGLSAVERRVREQFAKGSALCESPIERSMLAGLLTAYWHGFDALPPLVHNSSRDADEHLPLGELVIVPQMAFVRYRLDFGVIAMKDGHRRVVAVECDGAAFHADALKERNKVAYLKSWDVPVFKFSGALLHEDAIAAADVVVNAIARWKAEP